MSKLVEFAMAVAAAVLFAAMGAIAWQGSADFAHLNAPITPVLWLCSLFFWFCAVAYAGAAILTPFRKA